MNKKSIMDQKKLMYLYSAPFSEKNDTNRPLQHLLSSSLNNTRVNARLLCGKVKRKNKIIETFF